ncbi:hypothetical protein OGAPHI_000389 [Ogataea philodendri]|uniref:Tetratricopeptide SHNi-TPR domain-containing protein n=1 Tax=Ogataea philodendri TaxID=1378263 RepID=A0A9P8PI65_9ASCO|nr:uncharacterized protein OGAPHI_000389 [Ogataea philodendri]KAH3671684.1 hypothetical protein OGAPHI_000389 [Ogataea philodendri]
MSADSTYSEDLKKLLQKGAEAFAEKRYEKSVEYYSEACEKSNLLTGKDDPDLLFLYAKSLFENAVSNSGVLGGQINKEEKPEEAEDPSGMFQFNEQLAENEEEEEEQEEEQEEEEQEDDEKEQEEDEGEEQTDFEVTWEILDLTRTLYEEKLEQLDSGDYATPLLASDKQDAEETSSPYVVIKKKLSDVYDLLGEISLETENFSQAVQDLTTLTKLRAELYPLGSRLISEAYYKLSLASEFNTGEAGSSALAVKAMEKALESLRENYKTDQDRDESLLQEMEQRLEDLKKGDAAIQEEKKKIMMGILGESDATETVSKTVPKAAPVNDLTGMVKKRKQPGSKVVNKKVKTSK